MWFACMAWRSQPYFVSACSCAVLICLFHDFTGYSFGGALDTFGVGGCCRPALQSRPRGVCIWPVR